MGLFSGIIGLVHLQQRQLDLEYKVQDIQTSINQVSGYSIEIVTIGDELDPESAEFKRLNTRKKKLELMEKRLQSELTKYQTQLKIVNQQVESYQKMVDGSIKRLCTFGDAGR